MIELNRRNVIKSAGLALTAITSPQGASGILNLDTAALLKPIGIDSFFGFISNVLTLNEELIGLTSMSRAYNPDDLKPFQPKIRALVQQAFNLLSENASYGEILSDCAKIYTSSTKRYLLFLEEKRTLLGSDLSEYSNSISEEFSKIDADKRIELLGNLFGKDPKSSSNTSLADLDQVLGLLVTPYRFNALPINLEQLSDQYVTSIIDSNLQKIILDNNNLIDTYMRFRPSCSNYNEHSQSEAKDSNDGSEELEDLNNVNKLMLGSKGLKETLSMAIERIRGSRTWYRQYGSF